MAVAEISWLQVGGPAATSNVEVSWVRLDASPAPVAPPAPSSVAGASASAASATISIVDASGGTASHLIQIRRVGSPTWVDATGFINPLPPGTLSGVAVGLVPAADYEARARSDRFGSQSAFVQSSVWWQDNPATGTVAYQPGNGGVDIPPSATLNPSSATVTEGASVSLSAAFAGDPTPTYQWLRNGTPISGANALTLTFSATLADSGARYSCVASNRAGSATTTEAVLTVSPAAVAPSITTQPVDQSVVAGQLATFSVVASGTAPLAYRWMRNGATIPGAAGATYSFAPSIGDSGASFSVEVTNAVGGSTSAAAILTVTAAVVAPTVVSNPASATVNVGAPVTFEVAVSGTAPLTYRWRRNGTPIPDATQSSLTIVAEASLTGSVYSVVVTNDAGSATSSGATLTVAAASAGSSDPDLVIERGPWPLAALRTTKQPKEIREIFVDLTKWFSGRVDNPVSVSFTATAGIQVQAWLQGTKLFVSIGGGADNSSANVSLLITTTSIPATVVELDILLEVREVQ